MTIPFHPVISAIIEVLAAVVVGTVMAIWLIGPPFLWDSRPFEVTRRHRLDWFGRAVAHAAWFIVWVVIVAAVVILMGAS